MSLLSQIWGIDIAPFPAELATINLFRQKVAENGNFPRIVCQDVFSIIPGDKFQFPPPKVEVNRPQLVEHELPAFDAIIGNFPYVRAEQIEAKDASYQEFLRQRMLEGWFDAYPELFYYERKRDQANFEKLIAAGAHQGCRRDIAQHRISGFSDLYVDLFFHVARYLKPGGRIGIVTSNAWLDVAYGRVLQDFFVRYFRLVAVLESRVEPWFVEASVNTVVTILERCDTPEEREENLIRFVKVKKELGVLAGAGSADAIAPNWSPWAARVAQVERFGTKLQRVHPLGIASEEDDDFRVRILRQGEVSKGLASSNKLMKWGAFLRAPEVYFDLLRGSGPALCELGDLCGIGFGSKTGINAFYHVSAEVASTFNIEDEYLQPLVKARDIQSHRIFIDPNDLSSKVFVCRKSKEELRRLRHRGAIAYIEWGEQQRFTSGALAGMTWPNGIEVRGRTPGWYSLPAYRGYTARLFWMKAHHETYLQPFSNVDLIPDQRLYFLVPHEGVASDLLAAVLNSSIVALFLESIAPVSAGEGVCEVRLEDARDQLLVPDVRQIGADDARRITDAFCKLVARKVGKLHDELKETDRQALDRAVAKALGIEPRKTLKLVYEGLLSLVQERIALASLRNKLRRVRSRSDRAERKTDERVLDEKVPSGPRRFPDDFYSPAAASDAKIPINLPEQPLVFENTPMFKGVHVIDDSFHREVRTSAEGKFLLYAQRAGHNIAQLPKKPVEVSRMVADYEKYLRELRADLFSAYFRQTLDSRTAERLTQSAFDRFRLPTPESIE